MLPRSQPAPAATANAGQQSTLTSLAAPLSLAALESHLWEAANILRGPVDAADFKTYIFPLLFFKRISDVYDEEFAAAVAESGGDQEYARFAEHHRFQIPAGCHWDDVRTRTTEVGQGLQHALREIERANPRQLYGIFGDANWTNTERLSDALLNDLIDHFSRVRLANQDVTSSTMGQAYEFLIKKFADATNKKAGEFYTPRAIVQLMIGILEPKPGETIYDPACGTGGMLLEAVNHVRDAGGDSKLLRGKLFGQERNLTTAAIARSNLFLHGLEDFTIIRGDTLRQPAFFEGDHLARFDCVLANPPFSLQQWGADLWTSDPYGRNLAGVPPQKNGDYAWVQHMLRSLALGTGRMAVVLPHGVLFRGGVEGRIRQRLLEMDLLEAVIGLGPNLFYGTGLAASILVFRARKGPERQDTVVIVDASARFKRGRNQNTLEPEHVTDILNAYRAFAPVPGFAAVATRGEIEANGWNLNISRYVAPISDEESISVDAALTNLRTALADAYAAENRLIDLLRREGLLV